MTPDELIDAAASRLTLPEPIGSIRRSRIADAVLVKAAEAILTGDRQGNDAEAIRAAALLDSGFSEKQAATMARRTHDLILRIISVMLVQVRPVRAKRRGRPPKHGLTMTGAERQRLLQERRKNAEAVLRDVRERVGRALAPIREESIPDAELAAFLVGELCAIEEALERGGDFRQ